MHTRLLCSDLIEVAWKDPNGQLQTATAVLEDISHLGLCVQTETALPEGEAVLLRLNGAPTPATVQYCRWREIGYFAGLLFSPASVWYEDDFRPRHLTNPFCLPHRMM